MTPASPHAQACLQVLCTQVRSGPLHWTAVTKSCVLLATFLAPGSVSRRNEQFNTDPCLCNPPTPLCMHLPLNRYTPPSPPPRAPGSPPHPPPAPPLPPPLPPHRPPAPPMPPMYSYLDEQHKAAAARTTILAVAVAVAVAVVLLLVAVAAFLLRRWARKKGLLASRVKPPGVGPETTLLTTECVMVGIVVLAVCCPRLARLCFGGHSCSFLVGCVSAILWVDYKWCGPCVPCTHNPVPAPSISCQHV